MHRVAKAHRAHEAHLRKKATVVDSDDDFAPEDEDAWLYEDLRILTQLYARLRDREQLIGLIFEVRIRFLRPPRSGPFTHELLYRDSQRTY